VGHTNNLIRHYKETQQAEYVLSKDTRAAKAVFGCVYKGLKVALSFSQIIGLIAILQHFDVPVGNINHSKGTLEKIKKCIAKCLRVDVATVLRTPLECTGALRPISEVVDKMTLTHQVLFSNVKLGSTTYKQ
jgi:hypothetical protein